MQNREIIQIVISGTDTCKIHDFIKNIALKGDGSGDYFLPDNDANNPPTIIDLQVLDIEFFNICKEYPPYAFELYNTIKDAFAVICVDSFNMVKPSLSDLLPDCLFINYNEHEMTADECLIDICQGIKEDLISTVNTKAKILCEVSQNPASIFHILPSEITNAIKQSYIKVEFNKNPASFAFFTSEKNDKQPEMSEIKMDSLNSGP